MQEFILQQQQLFFNGSNRIILTLRTNSFHHD